MDSSLERELKQYQKRKAKAQDKGDLDEESKLCYAAAELLTQYGFYGDAVKEYKQALQVSEAKEDTIGSAVAHRMVGECLCALGKYKDALFHQNLHLQLAKSSSNLVEQQRAWATIGRTWFVYSDSALDTAEESLLESQKAYLESLSICDELQGIISETELLEMRSRLFLNLGLVYDSKNDSQSARKFIDKALHIAREQNLQETEFRCHYCIGGVLMKIGLDAQAQNAFEKAVKAARKNNKKLDEADALVQLGQVHLKMGDFLLARRTLKIAYKISPSQASGDMEGLKSNLVSAIKGLKLLNKLNELSEGKESEQVKILDALGDLYSNVKAFPKALEFYDKELDVAKSIGLSPSKLSPIYVSLAITYTDLGQPKKAVQCYMDELETIDGNYKGMCDTWCNVAQVHENAGADYDEVEKAYLIALTYAEKANKVPIQIRVNKCLADTQKKYQNMKLYAETMKKIEELESEFGIEEESDEEDKEHIEIDDNNEEEDDDDDSIIEREMLLPDSDEDDENEDSNDESVIKHRTRSSARAKLSKKNEKGETPLHRAAIAGDTELVRRLIDQGADINTRDYCGWQPLHEACNHGYTEIVRILLAKGANVNDPGGSHCQGVTPLHDAAQNGHIDIVKLLVENGASLLNKDVRGCTPLDAVIEAQESEEDEDLIGCETEAVSGRKAVEKYLKRISLGQPSSSKILKKQPEMRRRNRLFFDNNDSGNDNDDDDDDDDYDVDGDDDDDDDDDIRVPSLSRFNTKSQTKRKGESRKHPISPLDSDDDEDIPVPKNRESRVSNDSSADFPPKRSRNESRKTSKSPSRQTTSSKSPLRQNSSSKNDIDCEEERRSASENEDDFHVEVEDESSCSPINYDSEVKETNTRLLNESREQSFDTEGISVVDSTDWQSSDQYTSLTYVDTISGKRANANGSRNTTPALISERELGSTAVTSANDESVWLIDDLPERPTKRRRKQATLSASLVLSRRGPTTYRTRTPRNNSVSSSSRRASRPKQTRLEVRRTPSPTYLNCSPTSHHNHHGNDNSANVHFQSHSSGPSSQGDSTERQISVTSNPGGAPPMRVRVQVQGKTFLIPCPEKSDQDRKTISWLAEQAKLRYFSAFGLRPVLALQTSEGAFLSPEDKISDVLSNNEQIVASLESWDLPPLAERYKTACISSNCNIKKEVQAVLQAEPQISVISLGNLALKACHVLPLARALQCHDRLVKLILPGNKIGDSGVQHIASSLSTLPNLAVLDLQSNGITHKGITYLSNALSKYNDLQEITSSSKLEELDIAYNALYDTCGSPLANIILTCSQLSSLRLQSCCLTSKAVDLTKPLAEALKASRLRYLSVAHNVLGGQGLHDLLLALPCHVLRHLDVTSTVVNKINVTMAIEGLVRYMDKEDCALQNLNLGDCCLGTQDLERLTETRCFRDVLHTLDVSCNYIGNDASHVLTRVFDSKTLASLNLSSNSGITADSLKLILESHSRSSSRLQYINLSSCDIDSPITNDILKLLTKHITKTPCLLELDLSFCPLNQTDRMKIADVWKSNGCDDRQVIVQESYCVLSTNKN